MDAAKRGKHDNVSLLMETSWEVCNKIGGIYTVLSTKAHVLNKRYGTKLVFIGPDVWTKNTPSPYFKEKKSLFKNASAKIELPFNIRIRTGHWDIPGSPQVILISFEGVYPYLDSIFGRMWERFGVDSMHEYGDYREGCAFSIAASEVMMSLIRHLDCDPHNCIAHFNEWTTAMGLLNLQDKLPEVSTLFTTHATSIGRSICGNGKPLYDYFTGYNGNQMAYELNMEAKHSLERSAAHFADCFTAVSDLTADEAEQLLDIRPHVVTPNGFEPDFVPVSSEYEKKRKEGRKRIFEVVQQLQGIKPSDKSIIVATSGRNEYRNKGIDLFIDSLVELEQNKLEKEVIALILVPAWVKEINGLLKNNDWSLIQNDLCGPDYMTHRLYNEEYDSICQRLGNLRRQGKFSENIRVLFVPCYLDEHDGIVNLSYYDLLPGLDITVFPSYYEPWGYTPLESIAFGIPTITSDKSGFGQWILSNFINSFEACGVKVVGRTDSNYMESAQEIARLLLEFSRIDDNEKHSIYKATEKTAEKANWKYFIEKYYEAFDIAFTRCDERLNKEKN